MKMKQLIQKWLSVILVCVLAFVNIGGVGHLRIEAMEDTNYQNWLTNYLESNQAIENYFAYYTDTKDNIVFPEYFAGFKVCEDGSLTMFVTSDSLCLREDVKKICNLNELTFIATKYSFSELSQAIEALDDDFMSENGIKAATICIPENQVNVYYYDLSSYNRDAFSGMPFDCYNVIQYTSEKDMAYTTVFPDGNIYSAPQADIALNSETYTQKGILATTLKYGEYGYS